MVKQNDDFMLGNSFFGSFKLTKNAAFDKYRCPEYDFGFDARGSSSLSNDSGFCKNVIINGADMS